ncbi:MAG: glutamate racemase [Bacteroidetes bacterium]|nr:glutamate racemase [Bacteroidota bacterium]
MSLDSAIGVFDSGVGGVTVANAIRSELPLCNIIYVADSAHLPYGDKSLEDIKEYSEGITSFLIDQGCKIIVIACNTASAAALKYLRERFPYIRFIGMEPAVKPAAEQTKSGVVGVIATTATFQGELFASVVERFASGVEVIRQPCPGLVQQIEAGQQNAPKTEDMLRQWVTPMKEKGIDALVLGCTHYPFVKPVLEKILGPDVRIIDPAPAIARQVSRVAQEINWNINAEGITEWCTSGSRDEFLSVLQQLEQPIHVATKLTWNQNRLLR